MLRTTKIQIGPKHPLYEYCEKQCHLANNMYNASLYVLRQVLTGIPKELSERQKNEIEVISLIENTLPQMGEKYAMPVAGKTALSCTFLNAFFYRSENPDYFAEGFPRQSAQRMIKKAVQSMKGFYASFRDWKKHPEKYQGRPNLPKYRRSGSMMTISISNQQAVIRETERGHELVLPLTKERLDLGNMPVPGRLIKLEIEPYQSVFFVLLTFEDGKTEKPVRDEVKRVASIDFGVNNLAAMTNNIGEECLLFKGGAVKAENQWYNKQTSLIVSRQTIGTTNKFKPTDESRALLVRRNNVIGDFMKKTAKRIVEWCTDHEIDTIVLGVNKGWKRKTELGDANTQNFVQIPHLKLREQIRWYASLEGIRVVEQEESYTSKASFPDQDFIPVYGHEPEVFSFSGHRKPTQYKGMYKKDGFRGLYRAGDGTLINADLNGAANIGRKAFPDLFPKDSVNFENVKIIQHPDQKVIPLG